MRSISPKGSRSSTTGKTASAPTSAPTSAPAAERRAQAAAAPGASASAPPGAASHATPAGVAEGDVRIAAIDIGSNSIRAIVADVAPTGAIRVIDEMKAAPRLGAGLEATGEISGTAMRAAVDALARMATLARQLGAQRVEAVATSAVRDASNGPQFLARVREDTGLQVRLLDGEEEAHLSFRSALAHFELGAGRAVVMDIGGGSLELALSADGLLEHLLSLPFGAVRMTERYLRGGGRRKDVGRLRADVRSALKGVLSPRDWRGAQVIGSGGTFTNLAGIHAARRGIQAARSVHGTRVPRVELEHILDMLQEMTPAERLHVPGLNAGRADIIVAGLAVAAEVMGRVEARELQVSAYGIREGLLLETARVVPVVADPGEARERSVRAFAERCHYEEPHSRHVQELALQLFDQLAPRLSLDAADRAILADAALLHDIGYHINYDKHHKHSYHLVLHAELLGMTPEEQVAVANIARYHRGAPPKKKHRNFGALDKPLRQRIEKLSALLRVADGFDRGHVGAVSRVRAQVTAAALRLAPTPVVPGVPMRLEMWGASRKSALLAHVLALPVEIVGPNGEVVRFEDDEGEAD